MNIYRLYAIYSIVYIMSLLLGYTILSLSSCHVEGQNTQYSSAEFRTVSSKRTHNSHIEDFDIPA